MGNGYEYTAYDREVYNRELKDFLPDKIFDVHIHISTAGLKSHGSHNGGSTWTDNLCKEMEVRGYRVERDTKIRKHNNKKLNTEFCYASWLIVFTCKGINLAKCSQYIFLLHESQFFFFLSYKSKWLEQLFLDTWFCITTEG